MASKIEYWQRKYPNTYEFIMFNLLANIATISNFVMLFVGEQVLFASLKNIEFNWGPFQYTSENGGLGCFLAFLLSYAVAQIVNFIVQRKMVFKANNSLGKPIFIYIVTVLMVYFICLYVPMLLISPMSSVFGKFAIYAVNMINIMIQVVIIYPMMRFVIMKKA